MNRIRIVVIALAVGLVAFTGLTVSAQVQRFDTYARKNSGKCVDRFWRLENERPFPPGLGETLAKCGEQERRRSAQPQFIKDALQNPRGLK